jgi:predicted TIM-barrel fold metal-dependent hydrolase
MAYVENQTIHDADSHVMEFPEKILEYIEEKYRLDLAARIKSVPASWVDEMTQLHDNPEFVAGAETELMARRNHQAIGAFRSTDRPKTLDYLGFASQLVFTTSALSNYGLENGATNELALASARAHNRMMADFCSVDDRLLATGYVPLVDIEKAPQIAREAIDLGCKGIMIPSTCPQGHAPSHKGFDALWGLVQEAGLPILFHVGGEDKMNQNYTRNGSPQVRDFHGGAENFTALTYMSIPLALWQTLSALIMDGVFDRFENLQFGAIELGASWVPSWMRFLDSGTAAFMKGEARLQKLSAKPSEIAQRQFKVTPYPHEPTGWIIENSGPEMCMFSSDFPHIEGGRNPLKRFGDALVDISPAVQQRFYRDNFIDLMGAGLDSKLHGKPDLMEYQKNQ